MSATGELHGGHCRLGFDSINVTYVSATRLIIFLFFSRSRSFPGDSSGWSDASVAVDCRLAVPEHQTSLAL